MSLHPRIDRPPFSGYGDVSMRKRVGKKGLTMGGLLAWVGAGIPVLAVCACISGVLGGAIGAYLLCSSDLPAIPDLRAYRPKTVSTFYAEDDTVIGVFYKEKRFPIPVDSMPRHVIQAFLAAEDARFFSHPGVDWVGVIRAAIKNVGTGSFSQGGSTITQQVTRNFMLTKEKKLKRKIREAILAFRLEKTLTKQEILGLYLNEIYLGRGAYGVEAAARTYFGKNTNELNVGEAAFLAGLVANPNKGSSNGDLGYAFQRQEFVLDRMVVNGFISEDDRQKAHEHRPKFREKLPNPYQRAPYFTEAVRKYIAEKYGENRLYNEGLQVWTTCDPGLQKTGEEALLQGAEAWERRQGRPAGLVERLKPSEARAFLKDPADRVYKAGDLVRVLVVQNHTERKRRKKKPKTSVQDCTLALQGDVQFRMELRSPILYRTNDLLLFRIVTADENNLSVEQLTLPAIQGALVSIENQTGYVRTLVGGLSFERSSFNRATQAMRQPGSAFKPFVYAAALQWGAYGPDTLILDEPIAVAISQREAEWVPMNSDGNFAGPVTVRQALAQSRNIAAVKVMMDVGIDTAARMAHQLGIRSPLRKNISLCLGASEVTPLELTSAYTVFANMGVRMNPVLVKKVVDRFGTVLEDNTVPPLNLAQVVMASSPVDFGNPTGAIPQTFEEEGFGPPFASPEQQAWDQEDSGGGTPSASAPTYPDRTQVTEVPEVVGNASGQAVLSPQTAYLMTSLLHETCVSGTAASVARLGMRDLAGKTGTTDDCTDAWFVGFSPEYTTGVWLGFDTKTSLGRREYGNKAALPVWKSFMKEALRGRRTVGYPVPPGVVFRTTDGSPLPRDASRLLETNPAVNPEWTKPVCSVDLAVVPVAYQGGYPGAELYPQFGYPSSPYRQPYPAPNYGYASGGRFFPGAYGYDPMSGVGGYGYQSPNYPGTIRVLSTTGQSLGQAYYSVDKKGRISLYRTDPEPYPSYGGGQTPPYEPLPERAEREERSGRSDEDAERVDRERLSAGSIVPMVGRFLQNLPEFLAPFVQGGWRQ